MLRAGGVQPADRAARAGARCRRAGRPRRLRRWRGGSRWPIRGEVALGVLILLVAAVLTGLSPAREELARRAGGDVLSGPVDQQVNATGLPVRIQISPAVLGVNRLAVQLPGTDPSQVERVQLTLTFLDAELGSQPVVLPQSTTAPDTWETTSPLLSQSGTWQAELLVRRTGQDDARTALRFVVAGPGGAPQQPTSAAGAYPLLPSPLVSLAYLLIAIGHRRRRGRRGQSRARVASAASAATPGGAGRRGRGHPGLRRLRLRRRAAQRRAARRGQRARPGAARRSLAGDRRGGVHHLLRDVPWRKWPRRRPGRLAPGAPAGRSAHPHRAGRAHRRRAVLLGQLRFRRVRRCRPGRSVG